MERATRHELAGDMLTRDVVVKCWGEILQWQPNCRMLLESYHGSSSTSLTGRRLKSRMSSSSPINITARCWSPLYDHIPWCFIRIGDPNFVKESGFRCWYLDKVAYACEAALDDQCIFEERLRLIAVGSAESIFCGRSKPVGCLSHKSKRCQQPISAAYYTVCQLTKDSFCDGVGLPFSPQ